MDVYTPRPQVPGKELSRHLVVMYPQLWGAPLSSPVWGLLQTLAEKS